MTLSINHAFAHACPSRSVNTNASTGPNGQFTWLTCGINPNDNSTGWQPPFATVDQIITYPGGLKAAVAAENSPYKSCSTFVDLFETAGAEFQSKLFWRSILHWLTILFFLVPPLFIAAFALQESGCNPDTEGGGGEQGMMQISPVRHLISYFYFDSNLVFRTNAPTHPTVIARTWFTMSARPSLTSATC